MKKWNQINKRLQNIIQDDLNIKFIHSPLVKRTTRSELCIPFFYVKLNDEIIWSYPKDCAYDNWQFGFKWSAYVRWDSPWQGGQSFKYSNGIQYASPENIVAGYLDMQKDKLSEFDEPTGLKYILWACDKRIGKEKLSQMQFIKQALPIEKERVPDYNLKPCFGNGQTLVYTDEKISIFGNSEKWCFNTRGYVNSPNDSNFIITDNPSYSLSTRANKITFDGETRKFPRRLVSKKILEISPEIEKHILTALKSPSIHLENKTVWEELIIIENTTTDKEEDKLPFDKPLFKNIEHSSKVWINC